MGHNDYHDYQYHYPDNDYDDYHYNYHDDEYDVNGNDNEKNGLEDPNG